MPATRQPEQDAQLRPRRRKRRSTQEIMDRIIDAAIIEFGNHGYANATTAAIARRAEVAEALIFTNFGTKANLFRLSVFKPLDDHFAKFIAAHRVEPGDDEGFVRESRAFVSDLVHFVRGNSALFKSLVVNDAYGKDENGSAGLRGLQDYFNKMAKIAEARLTQRPQVTPQLIARISFASILGSIIFDDWLFPVGVASDREIHESICDFIMDGLNVNLARQRAGGTGRADGFSTR